MAARPLAPHLLRGQAGEDAAAAHLRGLGFEVLARNWRDRTGELDLVCAQGETSVFVEVKTRAAGSLASPAEAVTPAKRARLARAAMRWLSLTGNWSRPCRFDLVTVICSAPAPGAQPSLTVEHLPDAFDLTQAGDLMGRGHAAWQPW
jgi:putative endonuclease